MKPSFLKISSSDLFFRIGLSSIFLVNSLAAWFSPDEFLELLGKNPLASAIANPHFWLYIIGINDGMLFLLILFGRWRRTIAVWAAFWMVGVVYVTTNQGATGFIEHIGVLSFVFYYYFSFRRSSAER